MEGASTALAHVPEAQPARSGATPPRPSSSSPVAADGMADPTPAGVGGRVADVGEEGRPAPSIVLMPEFDHDDSNNMGEGQNQHQQHPSPPSLEEPGLGVGVLPQSAGGGLPSAAAVQARLGPPALHDMQSDHVSHELQGAQPSMSLTSRQALHSIPPVAELVAEEMHRHQHNLVERRRRQKINDRIGELAELLPQAYKSRLPPQASKSCALLASITFLKDAQAKLRALGSSELLPEYEPPPPASGSSQPAIAGIPMRDPESALRARPALGPAGPAAPGANSSNSGLSALPALPALPSLPSLAPLVSSHAEPQPPAKRPRVAQGGDEGAQSRAQTDLWRCEQCSRILFTEGALQRHMETAHDAPPQAGSSSGGGTAPNPSGNNLGSLKSLLASPEGGEQGEHRQSSAHGETAPSHRAQGSNTKRAPTPERMAPSSHQHQGHQHHQNSHSHHAQQQRGGADSDQRQPLDVADEGIQGVDVDVDVVALQLEADLAEQDEQGLAEPLADADAEAR